MQGVMPADAMIAAAEKRLRHVPLGSSNLGYINHMTERKRHDRCWPIASQIDVRCRVRSWGWSGSARHICKRRDWPECDI